MPAVGGTLAGTIMTRRRCSILTLAFVVATASVRADDVDDFIKDFMQKRHIPAVSVAVIKDGAVVRAQAYGFADMEHDIPAKSDTVFKIGSVSKQFIATGIMLLVQDGKVAVDDPVRKYLPDAPESWSPITLRHLLTHTSGLAREGPGFDPYKVQPDIDVIRTAYSVPLRFAPGEKWEYCNVGYFILADVIRQVSGKPWGDVLNERVFAPLHMTSTRVTTASDIVRNRAHGYGWKSDRFRNMEEWPAVRPSGAFLSTALDLAKWEAALAGESILKTSTKEQMWTPVVLNDGRKYPYGFGWQLDDFPAGSKTPTGIRMIGHGGSLPGFRAGFFRWPAHALTVIALTNGEQAVAGGLIAGVAVRYVPALGSAPSN
jgi:D-alanyl-D-alanine carboxypeptidase